MNRLAPILSLLSLVACKGAELKLQVDLTGSGVVRVRNWDVDVTLDRSAPVSGERGAWSLNATPAAGWTFDRWEGPAEGCAGTQPKLDLQVTGEDRCGAVFVLEEDLAIEVIGEGRGSVTVDDPGLAGEDLPPCTTDDRICTYDLDGAPSVVLTATPEPGSVFIGFEGGGCGDLESCTVALDGPTRVTAGFGFIGAPTTPPTPACPIEDALEDVLDGVTELGPIFGACPPDQGGTRAELPGFGTSALGFEPTRVVLAELTLTPSAAPGWLDCGDPEVICADGAPSAPDGTWLVFGAELSAPFVGGPGLWAESALSLFGPGPTLPPLLPGSEGAAEVLFLGDDGASSWAWHTVLDANGFPAPAPVAARFLIREDLLLGFVPRPPEARPIDGFRFMTGRIDDAAGTWDLFFAPMPPETWPVAR